MEMLASASIDDLTNELERANRVLKIAEKSPQKSNVSNWVNYARTLTQLDGVEKGTDHSETTHFITNYEDTPEGQALLENAIFAIPLPSRFFIEQELTVSEIEPALLLNAYPGDLEIVVENSSSPLSKQTSNTSPLSYVKIAEPSQTRLQIDQARIKSIDALSGKAPRTAKESAAIDERVALIRTPRVETNRGISPDSRRFVRGVLHSHPLKLRFGAIITLMLSVFLPAAMISAVLLFCSSEIPEKFSWVPKWLLLFPIGLPIIGIAYLIWGMSGSCRICGQKLFLPRMCIKNSKAHHITGLGYIIPVCLHMCLFKWFRCTYCGTPVRLKK